MLYSYNFSKDEQVDISPAFEAKQVSFELRYHSVRVPISFNFILREMEIEIQMYKLLLCKMKMN